MRGDQVKKQRIYIVELMSPFRQRWLPTVGVELTVEAGRKELREWRKRNPNDKFRLQAYARAIK